MEASRNVKVAKQKTTNITNRFSFLLTHPIDESKPLFSMDDDVIYSCYVIEEARRAFVDFRHMSPMTGMAPRYINLEQEKYDAHDANHQKIYNSLFVTKGGFLWGNLYREFMDPRWEEARNLVNTHKTGEDILMSFVHLCHSVKSKLVSSTQRKNIVAVTVEGKQSAIGKGCSAHTNKSYTDLRPWSGLSLRKGSNYKREMIIKKIKGLLTHVEKDAFVHSDLWWSRGRMVKTPTSCFV